MSLREKLCLPLVNALYAARKKFRIIPLLTTASIAIPACSNAPPILIFKPIGNDFIEYNYTIEISREGRIHYHGERDVNVIGDRYSQITPEQVQILVALFNYRYTEDQKILDKYFWPKYKRKDELPSGEQASLEDHKKRDIDNPNRATIFLDDGWTTIRFNRVGIYFNEFIGLLNEMTSIEQWLCLPKENELSQYCPIFTHSENYRLLLRGSQ